MASSDPYQYFTYEARLNSFQKSAAKKRGAAAGGRAPKALNWPHKQISPASLARAGFFFSPSPASPDNTVCFLCEKGLDGWEAGDDPLFEHIKHAPHCGWAVVAAIEAEIDDYNKVDPNSPEMIEARKATFGGKWPHDAKKSWKCKTKQLVEAGWKYTPTTDSDDMATCTYCQLALDGWEPNDKPYDEHYNRSPDCPFFALVSQFKSMAKNSSRGKGARTSKASRLSTQSIGSTVSETTVAPPPKSKRGKKRQSEAMEDSTMNTSEIPVPKKRAKTAPSNTTLDNSTVLHEDDTEMTDVTSKSTGRKKGQGSNTKSSRKAAEALDSNASMASLRAPPGSFPDDDEIERQLEAELERQSNDGYPMFDPSPHEPDESAIEDEFKALQAEMEVDQPERAQPPAKRGRGRPSKASLASQDLNNDDENSKAAPAPAKRGRGRPSKASLASQDLSTLSNATDAKDGQPPAKRPRGRPSKKSMEPVEIEVRQPSEAAQERPKSPAPTSRSLVLPSTPAKIISPAPSAMQPVLSPSQSPQASDAENQPPIAGTMKRVVLAPVTATPMRGSPSKRNVIARLRSANPWSATNLEAIFGTPRASPSKENEIDRFLRRGKDLTSPEKGMTVEEWIHFSATEAEKRLKHECETLVNHFEIEGTRAINVLEGLEVE